MTKSKQPHSSNNANAGIPELARYWPVGQQRFASAMAEIRAEMRRFASRRFDAHAKALKACANAADVTELLGAQRDYFTDLANDYSAESAEIMRRTQEMITGDWPAAKPE